MAKLTLTDIDAGYQAKENINANNSAIETAVENTLSRDGTTPNQMEAALDMNSYAINNLPDATNNQQPITLSQASSLVSISTAFSQENIGETFYPRSSAEVTAGITPTNYYYNYGNVLRYGNNTTPGTTDMASAIQAAVDVAIQGGYQVTIPAVDGSQSEYSIGTKISVAGRVSIVGVGTDRPRIVCEDVDFLDYTTKGAAHVTIENLYVAQRTRHTTSSNTYFFLRFQGDTSNRPYYNKIHNVFVDGFGSALKFQWAWEQRVDNVQMVNCGVCIDVDGISANCHVTHCLFDGTGKAITLGDGTNTVEGWHINNNLFEGNLGAIQGTGAAYCYFDDNIIDHQLAASSSVVFISAAGLPSIGHKIRGNYIAATGAVNEAIRLANAVSSSANTGSIVRDNEILAYSGGGSIGKAILVDGAEEDDNLITGNNVNATVDCEITAGDGHIVTDNSWNGGGINTTRTIEYHGNIGTIISNIKFLKRTVGDRSDYFGSSTITGTANASLTIPITSLDSSGGAVTCTVPDGNYDMQRIKIVMEDASTSSTVSVTSHETSSPEVFTFAQTTDSLILEWDASNAYWWTVKNIGAAT